MEIRNRKEGLCIASFKRKTKRLLVALLAVMIVNSAIDYSGISTAYADETHVYNSLGYCDDCGTCQPAEQLTQQRCSNLGISTDYANYYAIVNIGQLVWFSKLVNGQLSDTAQNTAANAILLNDISSLNISKYTGFTPIGTDTKPYTGTFDGNGHIVTLDIDNPQPNKGMFSTVGGGATVKNVGVAGRVVGGAYTAGLIGCCNGSGTVTISNCWNEATVTSSKQNAGGILGCNINATIIMKNCYNIGTVKGSTESAGISGWLGSNAIVENCYNTGTVTGAEAGKTFARFNSATFKNCYQLDAVGIQNSITSKSQTAFQSGEVCYLLNGEDATDATRVWYQNVDNNQTIDTYPKYSGGTVYKNLQVYTNKKSVAAITAIEGGIYKAYDGNAFELSTTKGTHFTWDGVGTAKIIGYYMDNNGTIMTTNKNSGAANDGGAPVNVGSYYAKVSITENDNFLATTGYVSFKILDKDVINLLNNPGGEMVSSNSSLTSNGWLGDTQIGSFHSVDDFSVSIGIEKTYGVNKYDATPVLSVVPHGGNYYMGLGVAMTANRGSAPYSCYQDVDISGEATEIDNNTRLFNLKGWLCATGGNTATITLKELDKDKNVVSTETYVKSITADTWTKVSFTGAVVPKVRYLQVTITCTRENFGLAAFDDLSLEVISNEEAPPVIAEVPDQTMVSGKTLGPLSFSVCDMDNVFNSLSITAVSSNKSLIPDTSITAKLSNGYGIISLSSVSGQTGQSTITVSVSDGTKTTLMSFKVIVNPDVQMDTELVVTGNGLYGWTDPGNLFSKGTAPATGEAVYSHNNSQASYMYQDINIGKFNALIDAGLLNFTASGNVYGNGSITLIFQNSYGGEISRSGVGSGVLIPSGTRIIRVEIGGLKGCTIGSVSFKINSTGLPRATLIENQTVNSGSSTEAIPFVIGYAGSSAVITAASSNTSVVPDSGISFGGSEYQRTVKVTPKNNTSGSSTIKIMVNQTEVASFLVTVIPPITGLTVQSENASPTYGYTDTAAPKLIATAQKAEGVDESKSITYQWYDGAGTMIKDATNAEYTVPIGLSVGSHSYYCEATYDWYTTKCDIITVTVQKAAAEITIAEGYTSYTKKTGDEAFTLTDITHTGDGTLTYTSSNEGIVTVDADGKVTIIGEGEAVITVSMAGTDNYGKADNKAITVQVHSQDYVAVTGVALSANNLNLKAGGAPSTLTAMIAPSNAANNELSWTSDNTAVALVTDGVVTPLTPGTAIITVTTVEGGYKATCSVTVEPSQPECPASYYGVQKRANANGTDIRLIAIINTLDADEVGFVYSESYSLPEIGKAECTPLPTKKVYRSIKVNKVTITAEQLGGNYIIVGTVNNIDQYTSETIYVRVYVKKGNEISYTNVKALSVNSLK